MTELQFCLTPVRVLQLVWKEQQEKNSDQYNNNNKNKTPTKGNDKLRRLC